MSEARIVVHADAEALARAVALEFARAAREAIAARGRFDVALAGGSTPKRTYELLEAALPWPRIHLWFGDERCVPADHADSNHRMVRDALLGRIAIPAGNVHRMRGEDEPAAAARAYEAELALQFELPPPPRAKRAPSSISCCSAWGPTGIRHRCFPARRRSRCASVGASRTGSTQSSRGGSR